MRSVLTGGDLRRRRLYVGLVAGMTAVMLLATGLLGGASATPASANQDLARARQATVQFHDVEVAMDAGYDGTGQLCVEEPGLGAMGVHFVNFAFFSDPAVHVEHPEALIYIPSGNGLRLVAIEYLKVDADQDLSTDGDRPSLFGRGFDGPMEGHGPGMPRHYDLHVWVWQGNPDGILAQFNPQLSCS